MYNATTTTTYHPPPTTATTPPPPPRIRPCTTIIVITTTITTIYHHRVPKRAPTFSGTAFCRSCAQCMRSFSIAEVQQFQLYCITLFVLSSSHIRSNIFLTYTAVLFFFFLVRVVLDQSIFTREVVLVVDAMRCSSARYCHPATDYI